MLRGFAIYIGVLSLIFLYVVACGRIARFKPTLAHYMITPFAAAAYGLVGTIIATIFIGSHAAIYLFIPISLLCLRKAWNDTRPEDPTKKTDNFWTG